MKDPDRHDIDVGDRPPDARELGAGDHLERAQTELERDGARGRGTQFSSGGVEAELERRDVVRDEMRERW